MLIVLVYKNLYLCANNYFLFLLNNNEIIFNKK